MKPLRVELRARNNVLWHAIFDHYPSMAAFCAAWGWPKRQGMVGTWLNLRASPWTTAGAISPAAATLCGWLRTLPEDLFPPVLYAEAVPRVVAGEYEVDALQALYAAEQRQITAPSAEAEALAAERERRVEAALRSLTPREEYIVRRRVLEAPDPPPTLEALGRELHISKEGVRRIQAKALTKLRERGRGLREFA